MDLRLPWSTLDPRRHAAPDFELARKPALSALHRAKLRTSSGRERAETELQFLVWTALGGWSRGWYDAVARGGPNRVWKGPDSVAEDDEETIATVIAALEDWQGWLTELAEAFDPIVAATEGLDDIDATSKAAAELLPRVLERTGAQGDWSRTFAKSLSWCLQACGRAEEDVSALIHETAAAHVEAGAAPADPQDLIDELALEVAARARPPFCDDALETWWTVRAGALWGSAEPSRPTEADGHRVFIHRHDRARSTVMADAFTRAMVRARYGAKKKLKLTPGLLREWLELALESGDFTFRRAEVFSSDEGERYSRPKDLEKRLEQVLADATDASIPPISRAARVWMDLNVLRPFSDGNERIARLTVDYVLSRDQLGMHDAAPVFTVRRWAHDKKLPWRFQKTLSACVGRA